MNRMEFAGAGAALCGAIVVFAMVSGSARQKPSTEKAVFAGGCFWCVQADFDKVSGVVSTTAGAAGGKEKNPTYEQMASGRTGHAESVEVTYDASKVTYAQLLDYYWRHVDPFAGDRQFCDAGSQYRPIIFYRNDEEKRLAEASKAQMEARFKRPIAVQILPATPFYKAEDYHQDFYKKEPGRYNAYRAGCGRDQWLEQIWGKTKR